MKFLLPIIAMLYQYNVKAAMFLVPLALNVGEGVYDEIINSTIESKKPTSTENSNNPNPDMNSSRAISTPVGLPSQPQNNDSQVSHNPSASNRPEESAGNVIRTPNTNYYPIAA